MHSRFSKVASVVVLLGVIFPPPLLAADTLWEDELKGPISVVIRYENAIKRRMTAGLSTPVSIDCPDGYAAISGGYQFTSAKGSGEGDPLSLIKLAESIPHPQAAGQPQKWKFQVKNTGNVVVELTMNVRVVCMMGKGK